MPLINVTISGADEATFTWDDRKRSLSRQGNKWVGAFNAAEGTHKYRIKVAGQPSDPWSGVVAGGKTKHEPEGEMNTQGRDQTPLRSYEV
jgi:hypothetical protein